MDVPEINISTPIKKESSLESAEAAATRTITATHAVREQSSLIPAIIVTSPEGDTEEVMNSPDVTVSMPIGKDLSLDVHEPAKEKASEAIIATPAGEDRPDIPAIVVMDVVNSPDVTISMPIGKDLSLGVHEPAEATATEQTTYIDEDKISKCPADITENNISMPIENVSSGDVQESADSSGYRSNHCSCCS